MINTTKVSCNNCNSNNFSLIGSGVDFEYQTSNQIFSFVKCKDCNLVDLNPRRRNSELSKIYPQHYLAYNLSEDDKTKSSSLAHKLRSTFYTSKVKYALKFLLSSDNSQISLLDVGAGDRRLLNWYKTIPGESAFNLPNFREVYLDRGKTRLRTSYIGYIFGLVFKH
jgi:hypothetical protein